MIKASALNHSKVTQCLRNRLFLLRWALRLPGILRLRLIVVLTLKNAAFLPQSGRLVNRHTVSTFAVPGKRSTAQARTGQ